MRYKINPFPAVRSNKNSWSDKTVNYHNKMNNLRELVGEDRDVIILALISGYYRLSFYVPMPEGWSKKKKEKIEGTPHQQTPDGDNFFKAFTDTLFYKVKEIDGIKVNDSHIWNTSAEKYWGYEGEIIFNITN